MTSTVFMREVSQTDDVSIFVFATSPYQSEKADAVGAGAAAAQEPQKGNERPRGNEQHRQLVDHHERSNGRQVLE